MSDYEKFSALLRYDDNLGVLFWKQPKPGRQLWRPAGHTSAKDGYTRIMIDYKMYLMHRIIWLLFYGEWPKSLLDHKDRNPRNSRIGNLRESNHVENGLNAPAKHTSKTGVRGIDLLESGRYMVRLRRQYIGTFLTLDEALRAKEAFLCNQLQNNWQ